MTIEPNKQSEHELIKREYYEQKKVVSAYESSRFGSPAGQWIKGAEEAAVARLLQSAALDAGGVGLDVPTGTGRMIPLLRRHLSEVIACDLSAEMLAEARKQGADRYVLADASRLPLPAASLDFVLSNRFFFHFADPGKFIAEISRVLKPGGKFVFDVYNWAPKGWIPGLQRNLGGKMFAHRRPAIASYAERHGYSIKETRSIFSMPPLIYRHLPLPCVKGFERLGAILPAGHRVKSYYLLQKDEGRP